MEEQHSVSKIIESFDVITSNRMTQNLLLHYFTRLLFRFLLASPFSWVLFVCKFCGRSIRPPLWWSASRSYNFLYGTPSSTVHFFNTAWVQILTSFISQGLVQPLSTLHYFHSLATEQNLSLQAMKCQSNSNTHRWTREAMTSKPTNRKSPTLVDKRSSAYLDNESNKFIVSNLFAVGNFRCASN